jgi:hypothetical protein
MRRKQVLWGKLHPAFGLLVLTSSLLMMTGCGSSGGDSASAGAIIKHNGDNVYAVSALLNYGPVCVQAPIIFTVTDASGNPLNGLNVELQTNGAIALHQAGVDCVTNFASKNGGVSSILTKTDSYGTVEVDVSSYVVSRPLGTAPPPTNMNISVQASSGSVSDTQTDDWTVTWQ